MISESRQPSVLWESDSGVTHRVQSSHSSLVSVDCGSRACKYRSSFQVDNNVSWYLLQGVTHTRTNSVVKPRSHATPRPRERQPRLRPHLLMTRCTKKYMYNSSTLWATCRATSSSICSAVRPQGVRSCQSRNALRAA